MMSARSEIARLGQAVSELANDLRARADRLGRTDLSSRISAEAARWSEASSTLVFVGTQGAGKSRLIGSLTGRPELFGGATTCAPTIVRQADHDACVVCRTDGRTHDQRVDDPIADPGRVEYLELGIDAPRLLPGLTLVDTPGLASAADPRGNRTYLTTRRADHLVVVIDLATPISRGELDFAVRCADRFAMITVVGTRIDRIRGWRSVLDDSAAALRAALPGVDITALGLSPALADAAFDPDLADAEADELLADSGLSALQAHLADLLDRRRHVRLANFSTLLEAIAGELVAEGRVVVQATVEGTHDDVDALADLRHQLTRVRDDRSTWLTMLADAVTAAREETATDLNRTLSALLAAHEPQIDAWKGDATALLDQFDDALRTEAAAIATRIADRIERVVELVAGAVEADNLGIRVDVDAISTTLAATGAAAVAERETAAADGRRDGQSSVPLRLRATGGLVGMATSTTMMLTALAGPGGAAALMRVGAFGAAALFSGVSTAVTVAGGRRQRDQQQIRAAVKARVDAIRADSQSSLRRYFTTVQRGIEAALKDVVRDRIAVLEREISELQTTARADATERRRRLGSLEDEVRHVAELQERSREMAGRLAAVRAS
jgi:hypothetical protein